MLTFELSKMIYYIYNYGKCVISIKLDDDSINEIEIKATDDGLNIGNDSLLQIMSLLYSESFLPAKYNDYRKYFIRYNHIDSSDDLMISIIFPLLVNGKIESTVEVKSPDTFNKDIEKNVKATLLICSLMETMLIYSSPLTDDLNISAYNIYFTTKKNEDLKEYFFDDLDNIADLFDKNIIPMSILEVLKLRKSLLKARKIGNDSRKSIIILSELFSLKESNNLNKDNIKKILEKYGYNDMAEEIRIGIDEFLRDFGFDPQNFLGNLSK